MQTVKVWEASTGNLVTSLKHAARPEYRYRFGNKASISEFNSTGDSILVFDLGGQTLIWSLPSRERILAAGSEMLVHGGFSQSGDNIVAASWDGTVRVWEAHRNERPTTIHHSANYAEFSPDGKSVVLASLDGTARVCSAETGDVTALFNGHYQDVYTAKFSPDGLTVVTASRDGTARIWDAETGDLLHVLKHDYFVFHAVFSKDGRRILTSSGDGSARIWEPTTGKELHRLVDNDQTSVMHASFSSDGGRVITGSTDGKVRLWNATTGHLVAIMEGHRAEIDHTAISLDDKLAITTSKDFTILWDLTALQEVHRFGVESVKINHAVLSPDGTLVAAAMSNDKTHIWDTKSGALLTTLKSNSDVAHAVFSPDGSYLASLSWGGDVQVWKLLPTGQRLIDVAHEYIGDKENLNTQMKAYASSVRDY